MFSDMGTASTEESSKIEAATVPWIEVLITKGQYVGWLAEEDGRAVASAGAFLRELGPEPGCPRIGSWIHIANVYTERTHRRQGLSRRLMWEALTWCKENNADKVTLAASDDGRKLYESLGFVATPDMRLPLR